MKFRKLVFECGLIAASVAVISASSAVSVSAAETADGTVNSESEQNHTENNETNQISQETVDDVSEEVLSEEDLTGEESTADEASEEQESDETSAWADKLLVIVEEDSSLNIRKEPNTDSEVVGKLSRGAAAEVVEKGEEWSKIVSGDVEGYVSNAYCVFAEEAEAQAAEICDTEATVTTDGVRLRSDSSTESTIYKVLEEGDSLTVSGDAEETEDGWIQVQYGDGVAYVSADYVDVELAVGEAVSMEEIYEQQAQAAQQAAAAKAASDSASASSATGTSVSASSDDTTLLAALIQCEAGGESYAGQLAVGAVVMNRVKSGSFPNTISGVIYQSGQFAPASSGKLSRVLSSGNISSSCYQAAQAAIGGEDNTGGAKYFHAGSGSGTVIGSQVFY
ncbi:MAG: cell wall hydrolase [Clostridiales bacterium]|nr:cell wall hydrolase [Clostridiales bacterium]